MFTITLIFAFVVVYIPQAHVKKAEAFLVECPGCIAATGAAAGVISGAIDTAILAQTAALEIPLGAISLSTASVAVKELSLDMVLNAIAKAVVSSIVASTVEWINSGFKGSPAFVTDLGGFLLETLDKKAFEIIEELGGDASFLCTPFKLDIQLALAISYDQARLNRPYEGCSVSNFVGDLEQFINGDFEQGGWRDWIRLTSNPEKYTPVGQYYSAKASFEKQQAEEKERQRDILGYGSGFQSAKVCEGVERASSATGAISNTNVTAEGVQNANTTNFTGGISNFNISADSVQNANTTNFTGGISSFSGASSPSTATASDVPVGAQADPIKVITNQPINTSPTVKKTTTIRIPTGLSIGASLRCAISKPGRMIADRLSKSLGLSDDSLISADEIGEIISALFAQLATKALTGTAGLLGLTPGTGYTSGGYQGGSYIEALRTQSETAVQTAANNGVASLNDLVPKMEAALTIQNDLLALSNQQIPILENYLQSTGITLIQRDQATVALDSALRVQRVVPGIIRDLPPLINKAQLLQNEYNGVGITIERKNAIIQELFEISAEFARLTPYSGDELASARTEWDPSRY